MSYSADDLGLPLSFSRTLSAGDTTSVSTSSILSNHTPGSLTKKKSRSMSSLAPPRQTAASSVSSSSSSPNKIIAKGVLRPSSSLPQLRSGRASMTSLTSIPEGNEENEEEHETKEAEEQRKNLNLRWGGVEEYCPNDETDSKASSGKTDVESDEDEGEEEDDGWGWYEADPETSGTSTGSGEKERRQARTESLSSTEPQQRVPKDRKPLVRVLSQSTPLDPSTEHSNIPRNSQNDSSTNAPSGGSLLLLGSDQWPERRTRKRRDRASRRTDFTTLGMDIEKGGKNSNEGSINMLEAFVQEARSKGWPIWMSSFLIFSRGAATGYALRALPNFFLRAALSFYSETATSNHREAVRTGLFLGSTMATYHIMVMNNVAVEQNDDQSFDEEPDGSFFAPKDRWIPVTAALLTPLVGFLPSKSRLSIALFVAARASESIINGLLSRLSKNVREQLPVSKWLFALGSAQVVFCWLFHRDALPSELATFLDKSSSSRPDPKLVDVFLQSANKSNYEEALKAVQDMVYPATGEPIIKRILLGSGLIELIASDVFSAASLFGPVFAFPLEFWSSLARGARSAAVLVADVTLSGFALISLSRLLRRVAPANGWWAGFVAGLVAIQGEVHESRRVEMALFALIYAVRALYNMAASRQVIPANIKFGEFGLYFVSLLVVLKAATTTPAARLSETDDHKKRRPGRLLVLGSTFRTLIKRCIIPG